MEFFDLVNISEEFIEIINPFDEDKLLTMGKYLDLKQGQRVIDYGCGYGEMLLLWAENFGISGVGIDIRKHVCDRAKKKIQEKKLGDRIEIICQDGAAYSVEKGSFDVAACIGATFIWGGFRPTIQGMKDAIHPNGKLAIGEPYWMKEPVPEEYKHNKKGFLSEYEIIQTAREEGFDFQHMVRASQDDWDRYEAGNWYGLVKWIEKNPNHPELQEVVDHLHKIQDEYLRWGREYCGWAVYTMNPVKY